MKKSLIFSIIVSVFTIFSFISCENENNEVENTVDYSALPNVATKFLETYFGGKDNVNAIEKITVQGIDLFKVSTKDGYQLTFNSGGYWQEIDAPEGATVPMAVIPEAIQETLNYQYHGFGVVSINTAGENYHLVLSNNQGGTSIDLMFNQAGEIISTSNS